MSTASPPRPSIGDPAPWFTARMLGHATDSDFDKAGGRHVLLLLFGSAADPACGAALRLVEANAALLDDRHALFVGVTVDQKDVTDGRLAALQRPGMHFILDADQRVSGLRADRFVSEWQQRSRLFRSLERSGDMDAADRTRASLRDMAKSLQRDPQLESLLRNRRTELGLSSRAKESLSHELAEHLGLSRSRGIGL